METTLDIYNEKLPIVWTALARFLPLLIIQSMLFKGSFGVETNGYYVVFGVLFSIAATFIFGVFYCATGDSASNNM